MNFDIGEIKDFIRQQSPETTVYIGTDSERWKKQTMSGSREWWADYIVAVVVHIDGNKGCRVFGKVQSERDYDQKANRPFNRMMREATLTAETFLALQDVLWDREFQLHLDINPNESMGSNVAYQAAMGYIKGVCNVTPIAKPDAFAASFAADRFKEIGNSSGALAASV